jgi:hypothetical protein
VAARVDLKDDGYYVEIQEIIAAGLPFSDYCSDVWDLGGSSRPSWAMLPQSPEMLNTDKQLHYLAGQMIRSGVVDAKGCPSGGLNNTDPNGCGIMVANDAMIAWQNQFDFDLWWNGYQYGIPPVLLKAMIENESQFWPQSARYFLDEFGLAQVNELGADVALRWDLDYYNELCPSVLAECNKSYFRLSPDLRAMLRGATVQQLNSDCSNCPNGLDMGKAQNSVRLISIILRSNCADTRSILDGEVLTASYEDYWKFTMLAYHSGADCLRAAVKAAPATEQMLRWDALSPEVRCVGGVAYVNSLWERLNTFNDHLLKATEMGTPQAQPTYLPTSTPVPLPTQVLSQAVARIQVFVDANNDGIMQPSEGVNDALVSLLLDNGDEFHDRTVNGEAVFDLSGYPIGMGVNVSLPGLYRHDFFRLPAQGEVVIQIPFGTPIVPTQLP